MSAGESPIVFASYAEHLYLLELLARTYTPEGIEKWMAHAAKQGWGYEECLSRALAMAEGTFV